MTNPYPGNSHWPGNFQGCTFTGKYLGLDGDPLRGTITFKPSFTALVDIPSLLIIIPKPIVVNLDNTDGNFSIVVPATDDPDIAPTAWTYSVTENLVGGGGRTYIVDAPMNTVVDLSEVTPLGDPSDGVTTFYSASQSDARYITKVQAFTAFAKTPEALLTGTLTRNGNGIITSADVVWPDGTAGVYTADTYDADVTSGYHITYLGAVTKTYTQPTITRDSSGAAIVIPAIVVT